MKNFIITTACILISLLTFAFIPATPVNASSTHEETQIVSDYIDILEDGSCFHITITETLPEPTTPLSRTTWSARSTQTKSGAKRVTYYNSNGELAWEFTLYGTFQYIPGSSAACTSSSYSFNIYDSNWENTYASASKRGNQATGNATFKERVLFITTTTENVYAVLSCSAYGTLS